MSTAVSPMINRSESIIGIRNLDTMDWPTAQHALLEGKKIRREEWPDDNVCIYLAHLDDEFLVIRKSNMSLDKLLLRGADMRATDWVVVREN